MQASPKEFDHLPDGIFAIRKVDFEHPRHLDLLPLATERQIVYAYEDLIRKVETAYLIRRTECGYWRKNYKLSDTISGLFQAENPNRSLENDGCYRSSESMREVFKQAGAEFEEEDVVFYREWY